MHESSTRHFVPSITRLPVTEDMGDSEGDEVDYSPIPAHLVRHRIWLYLVLLLLAVALIVVDQRATGSPGSTPASAGTSDSNRNP
jgi:hypothetical protein